MRKRAIKSTFAGGELADSLEGRVDVTRYDTSVQKAENFFVTRFGSMSNRPGTEFIGKTPWGTNAVNKLIPFEFSVDQSYMTEWSSRDIEWFDDFNSTVLNPAWTKTGDAWQVGAGVAVSTPEVGDTLTLHRVVPSHFEDPYFEVFDVSGLLSAVDENGDAGFPDGSAGDVWTNTQEVKMTFVGGEEVSIAFENGSLFGATNYKGYRISRSGESDVFIDATEFTKVGWSISKTGTSDVTVRIAGVDYAMTITNPSTQVYTLTMSSVRTGVTAPASIATFSGIRNDLSATDLSAQADNVMRVIKDGAIVKTSRVNDSYKWTLSGSGSANYHCEAAAGGDPSIPGAVEMWSDTAGDVLTRLTEGALGSLTAGQWAWGDNDSLGYGTLYVRLFDSVDPDSKADGYVQSDYQLETGVYNYAIPLMDEAQDKDVMYLASWSFAPKKLVVVADDDWTISAISFTSKVETPQHIDLFATNITGTQKVVKYGISAINEDGVESLLYTDEDLGQLTTKFFWDAELPDTVKILINNQIGRAHV